MYSLMNGLFFQILYHLIVSKFLFFLNHFAGFNIFFSSSLPFDLGSAGCVNQLQVLPDIQPWKNIYKETSAINTKLNLHEDRQYFTAVRATFRSGVQVIVISNGFHVVNEGENILFKNKNENNENVNNKKSTETRYILDAPLSCSIDESNRCTSSQISVADRLRELYGAAIFTGSYGTAFLDDPFAQINNNNDDDSNDDDDDDGSYIWVLAPILGVVLLAICLVLLCLLLLFLCIAGFPKGGGGREPREKPQKAAPMEFEEVNDQKGYGVRDGVANVDASTNTVVEFPDTNIRRLSISHQDAPDLDPEASSPRRGRIAHPIMNTASSSFRDYRSSVNH